MDRPDTPEEAAERSRLTEAFYLAQCESMTSTAPKDAVVAYARGSQEDRDNG